ncbi:MAG TPA: AraC family transcriptional regulator [Tissierellaceae bacterium]
MIQYENKLLYSFNKADFDYLIDTYDDLFNSSLNFFRTKKRTLRMIKNYYITINASIYTILYEKPVCKINLYKKRNTFTNEIESCEDIKDLYTTCKDMIIYYSQVKDISIESCSHPVITDTVKYIHDNLDKDLTLENVANEVHVSKNYLSLLFSKFVGLSFSDYINKLRIEKAKTLLKNGNLNLIDVALECGFNSQSYFCSVFKKFEKISPKKYQHNISTHEFDKIHNSFNKKMDL